MEKKTFDMRGKQSNIARLSHFHAEGFVHMLFYRVMIFLSIFYGLVVLLSFQYPYLGFAVKPLTVLVWFFFTPQVYETAKGFALIQSKGLALGHLSEEYTTMMKNKYKKGGGIYQIVPYVTLTVWAIGFIAMLFWWQI